jgi:hypothetical protein
VKVYLKLWELANLPSLYLQKKAVKALQEEGIDITIEWAG